MRIDGFQNIPAVLQSLNSAPAPKAGSQSEPAAGATSVSLSSFAEILQSLQRDAAQASVIRNEKVEDLAQQNQKGNLSVDLNKLASHLVESQVINIKG